MRGIVASALAALLNPSPERLGREAAWLERHPLAALALMTAPGWAVPLVAMTGWLS